MDRYLSEMCSPASEAATALGHATETAPWGELHMQGKTMFRFSNAWTTGSLTCPSASCAT